MHCADICLSATHNESARKLVMTQFEPCQYRHKSRYASVLQNRCFYTYIWLAYLVRFFERLLRQTTPKLLPLFECLPLLFLLMSLRYSVFPNILGTVSGIKFKNAAPSTGCFSQDGEDFNTGISTDNPNPAQSYAWSRPDFIASRSSPIYGLSETVQTASIRTLCLVRAYQA